MPAWIPVAIVIIGGLIAFHLLFTRDLQRAAAAGDELRGAEGKLHGLLPFLF